MTTATELTPGEFRETLEDAGLDVRASAWPEPGFVIANGKTFVPTVLEAVLIVNGKPMFSAAWR